MADSVKLFGGKTLTGSFVPSLPVLLSSEEMTLDFTLVTTTGPTKVDWYPEFSVDLVNWFQEVAEEDSPGGVILMPKTIRTFADNAGTALADGTHLLSVQLVRQMPFARIQARVSAGAAIITTTCPSGSVPQPA